jgi:chorismate mutase
VGDECRDEISADLLLVGVARLSEMSEPDLDPTIRELRDEIASLDRGIVDAVNARIELVERLRRRKESLGIAFVDPEQERRLLDALAESNDGPLSSGGLTDLVRELLALTKRELS